MAHLEPLSNEQIEDDSIRERFEHYQQTRGFTPNSIRTMARRPNIVKAFMALNQAVLYEGTVDEQLKMLISLISSVSAGCLYCQSHMTNLSHRHRMRRSPTSCCTRPRRTSPQPSAPPWTWLTRRPRCPTR
jgi:alkylhydroperoxidase family enzyme